MGRYTKREWQSFNEWNANKANSRKKSTQQGGNITTDGGGQGSMKFERNGRTYKCGPAEQGDWPCLSCGFPSVRAKRLDCHVCKAPRASSPATPAVTKHGAPTSPTGIDVGTLAPGKRPPNSYAVLALRNSASAAASVVGHGEMGTPTSAPAASGSFGTLPATTSEVTAAAASTFAPPSSAEDFPGLLASGVVSHLQGLLAAPAAPGLEQLMVQIKRQLDGHYAALAAKGRQVASSKLDKRMATTALSPSMHLSKCKQEVSNQDFALSNAQTKIATAKRNRASAHEAAVRTLEDLIKGYQEQLKTRQAEFIVYEAEWEAHDKSHVNDIEIKLSVARAAVVDAQMSFDVAGDAAYDVPVTQPATANCVSSDVVGDAMSTASDAVASLQPPRPLVAPPSLPLNSDPSAQARLLHARMVVEQFQQQDVIFPLTFDALGISVDECSLMIGEVEWRDAFETQSPGPHSRIPRRVIGLVGSCLRQLEMDATAQRIASTAAQATFTNIVERSKRSAEQAQIGKDSTETACPMQHVSTGVPSKNFCDAGHAFSDVTIGVGP